MKLTEFDDVEVKHISIAEQWFVSHERTKALWSFLGVTFEDDDVENWQGEMFRNSREFANARHAYRKRVNR